MKFEKYKKQVHTKFTQKITFGNNIKIKYPYNINMKNMGAKKIEN